MSNNTTENNDAQQVSQAQQISLWQLFSVFFQIGCFTFGGGYAMLPLIQKAVVDKNRWMQNEEFVNMIAITNSAPGAFAINCSIFIGYRLRGYSGVITAALGTILPSFVIILIIAYLILQGKETNWLNKFFAGVRPAVIALILGAGLKMGKNILKIPFDFILLVLALGLMIFTPVHPVFVIILGSVIGFIYTSRKGVKK